jgi:hypothetical protein
MAMASNLSTFGRTFGNLGLLIALLLSAGARAGSVDLRPAFETWQLERRVQGSRNTCSVFAVTGALEYALASRTGKPVRLSVEFLNWASNKALGEVDDGSFFSDLWRGFEIYGACPERDMPYRDTFDSNVTPSEQAKDHARQLHEFGFRLHWIKPWNPNTGLTDEHLAAIKRTLDRKWPSAAAALAQEAVRWTNDILETPPPKASSTDTAY